MGTLSRGASKIEVVGCLLIVFQVMASDLSCTYSDVCHGTGEGGIVGGPALRWKEFQLMYL